ncbi:Cholesterol desaturase daf-36 [Symbiodinium microadriaticum]|uniref:Cholesterol desaturase daf-36 n=1 Tax=Symbiodinium microadriaticum TaxID=2951 RepID=A0A1Q9EJK3_SYMMI|nr:Cholesterol desaturase daf-36 [Symbiodinium microadriaticum]
MDPADDGTGSDVRLAVLFAQQKRLSSRARQDFFMRLVEDDVPNKTVEADLQAPSQLPRRHRPRAAPARPSRLEQDVSRGPGGPELSRLVLAGRQLCLSVSLQSATLFFVGLYQLMYDPRTKDYNIPKFCNESTEDVAVVALAMALVLVVVVVEDGKAAVLHAFCPHMGAHLGMGGVVVGNSLYLGSDLAHVPYRKTAREMPSASKLRAYTVRENLERVYIWFDAEGRPPQWELECHKQLEKDLADGSFYLATIRQMEFDQHCCEMHMNSADPYHFKIVEHGRIQEYGKGVVNGQLMDKEHMCSFEGKLSRAFFLRKLRALNLHAKEAVTHIFSFERTACTVRKLSRTSFLCKLRARSLPGSCIAEYLVYSP